MSLNKEFFERDTNIKAKVICDSISEEGVRLTTFEIEYPRIIMSEFNTHRAVSRNSSSSRAIPVSKMLEHTQTVNLKPVYFGSKKAGMQAGKELDGGDLINAKLFWESALFDAVTWATELDELGVAKEVTNRLVEPFQLVKVVCTATDWDNFFNLRLHPDADPNICMLAYKMYTAMEESEPTKIKSGDWHLPYIEFEYWGDEPKYFIIKISSEDDQSFGMKYEEYLNLEDAIKISAASCASVSYRTEGMTLEKADKIFDMLIKAEVVHSSPFEHLATPIVEKCFEFEIPLDGSSIDYTESDFWQEGVTHRNKQGQLCSGNFTGWVQYRHLLPNNTAWSFDFEERMKMFE